MNFSVIDGGQEVETEYYNFDALNIPKIIRPKCTIRFGYEAANDTNIPNKLKTYQRETFTAYSHQSMQIRYMEKHKPRFK